MTAQDHAFRVHSYVCRLWDELWLKVESNPRSQSYPNPTVAQHGDDLVVDYPNCCSYIFSSNGSAICKEHDANHDASTSHGAFGVALELVRYITSNSHPAELSLAVERILDELDVD